MASSCNGTWVTSYEKENGTVVDGYCRNRIKGIVGNQLIKVNKLKQKLLDSLNKTSSTKQDVYLMQGNIFQIIYQMIGQRPTSLAQSLQLVNQYVQTLRVQRQKLKLMVMALLGMGKQDETISKKRELDQIDSSLAILERIRQLVESPNPSLQSDEFLLALSELEEKLRNELNAHQSNIQQLASLQSQYGELMNKVTLLESQKQELTDRLNRMKELEDEISRLKVDHPEKVKQHEEELEMLRQSIKNYSAESDRLQFRISQLEQELADSKRTLLQKHDSDQSELDQLRMQVKELQRQFDSKQNEYNQLDEEKNRLSERDIKHQQQDDNNRMLQQQWEEEKQRYDQRVEKLNQRITELEDDKQNQRHQIASLEERIKQVEQEKIQSLQQNGSLDTNVKDALVRIASLESELAKTKEELTTSLEKEKQHAGQIQTKGELIASLESRISALTTEKSSLQSQWEETKQSLEQLKVEHDSKLKRINELDTQLVDHVNTLRQKDKLEIDLRKANEQVNLKQTELAYLQSQLEAISSEQKGQNDEKDRLLAMMKGKDAELTSLQATVLDLESKLSIMKTNHDRTQVELLQAKQRVQELEGSVVSEKVKIEDLQRIVKEKERDQLVLQSQKESLERDRDQHNAQHVQKDARISELESNVNNLTRLINQLKSNASGQETDRNAIQMKLESELKYIKKQLADKIKESEEQSQENKRIVDQLSADKERLVEEQLNMEAIKQRELKKLQDKLTEQEILVEKLTQTISDKETRVVGLEQQSKEIDALQVKLSESLEHVRKLQDAENQLRIALQKEVNDPKDSSAMDRLNQLLEKNKNMVKFYKKTLDELRAEFDAKILQYTALEKELSSLKPELEAKKQELLIIAQEKAKLEQTVAQKNAELLQASQGNQDVAKIQAEVNTLHAQLQSKTAEIDQLRNQLQEELRLAKSQVIDTNASLTQKTTEVEKAKVDLQAKQVELDEAKRALEASQQERDRLKEELALAQSVLEKVNADSTRSKSDVDEKNAEVQVIKQNVVVQEAKIQELIGSVSKGQEEIARLQGELELKNRTMVELQSQLKFSQDELSSLRLAKQTVDAQLAKCNTDNQTLRQEAQVLRQDVELSSKLVDGVIAMLRDASVLLDQTPYKGLADGFRANLDKVSNRATDFVPLTLDIIPSSIKAESKVDKISTSLRDSALPQQSKAEMYKNYDTLLGELRDVEDKYVQVVVQLESLDPEIIAKLADQLRLAKYASHPSDEDEEGLQKDQKTTFLIYSFLATALFMLTRTVIRFPNVLRLLSLEGKNVVSEQNRANKEKLIQSLQINVDGFLENNSFLSNGNSRNIYDKFKAEKTNQGNVMRIDVLAYYLLQFMNIASKSILEYTGANDLFNAFDNARQTIQTQLLSVFKAVGDSATSVMDEIDSKDHTQINTLHQRFNPVVTFVKLRMDGGVDINKRFRCTPLTRQENEKEQHIMHLEYCDFDWRYGPGENKFGNSEFMANGFPFYFRDKTTKPPTIRETVDNLDSIIPYNSDMYFGPFSRIYAPYMSNSDIVNDPTFSDLIEQKLRQGNPVCMIGYGASGSGKTSTLVYFRPDVGPGQDGILSVLSNNLSDLFDTVKIKVYEFEGNISSSATDPVKDYIIRKYPPEPEKILVGSSEQNVIFGATSFVQRFMTPEQNVEYLDPKKGTSFEYIFNSKWIKTNTGRKIVKKLDEEEYKKVAGPKTKKSDGSMYQILDEPLLDKDGQPILMASDIVDFMDNKRSVAATANNPVSSRSHVIIFIEYSSQKKPDTKPVSLVLCDFAGVENKFDCESQSTLNKLGSIPIKGDPNDTPFYESKTNGLKIEKYETYLKEGQTAIQETLPKLGPIVEKNVKWILKELINRPLPIKEDAVSAKGLSAELAEKECQTKYKNPIDPLLFLSQMTTIASLQDTLVKKLDEVIQTINKDKSPTGFKNTDDARSAIKNMFSAKVTFEKIPNDSKVVNPLVAIAQAVGVTISMKNSTLGPIKKTDSAGITDWIAGFLAFAPKYGSELFVDYDVAITSSTTPETVAKAKLDKRTGLQVIQYMFEYGIIGVNTISDATPTFMKNICLDRVKEGLYINDSLTQLRKFISQLVQKDSKGYPAFTDRCAPIQCNPSYQNCFGINNYQAGTDLVEVNSSLAQQIKKVENAENMTFCIMCVVNLSQMSANNPPVSPYINITALTAEYERLQLVESQYFMDKNSMQEAIKRIVDGRLLSNSFKVNPEVLTQLRDHRLLKRPLDPTFVTDVKRRCDELIDKSRGVSTPDYLRLVRELIDIIYNSNAITTVGTLEFTDTMAKFGTNSVTCTMSYNPIMDDQEQAFLNGMNGFMSDTVFNGLQALEKRNKLFRDKPTEDNIPSTVIQLSDFTEGKTSKIPRKDDSKVESKEKIILPTIKNLKELTKPQQNKVITAYFASKNLSVKETTFINLNVTPNATYVKTKDGWSLKP